MIPLRSLLSSGVAAATVILGASALHGAGLNEPPPGFTALFNGKDLTGWVGGSTFDPRKLQEMPDTERKAKLDKWASTLTATNDKTSKPHWYVENGELVNDGFGDYATTGKDYGDVELYVDYKTVPLADSGIYLRGVPQVQIWDYTEEKKFPLGSNLGSGGLWNNDKGAPGKDPLVLADKPFGEWNHFHIIMVGSRVTVWLNDKLVVDHAILQNYYDQKLPLDQRRPILPRGPIELQTHGGEIRWRNLFVREIGSDEACKILESHSQEGFESIFNGKDLTGWTMDQGARDPGDVVKVEDGAMVWQLKKGGSPYWNTELNDFVARLEFKMVPGGNNGLAIRYPGTGTPAYEGMCESQVLDDNYEVNKAKLVGKPQPIDPRQAHGSAYAMVAAARGYQHPLEEWNFEEVTVKGHNIKVELNGTVILDTDLSKVTPEMFMANHPHPGKDRTSGFFGFAGHNDPVSFRKIFIKRL
jgi:hypothetical protein